MDQNTCTVSDCAKQRKPYDHLCSMHRARWTRHKTFDYVGHKAVPLAETMKARIVRGDGCWTWTGYHDRFGYAKLRHGKQNIAVHRWVYENMVGPLIDGMVIDHACRNSGCIRPDHLRQVTVKQNVEHFTTRNRSSNTSGYRGVSFHKPSRLWVARVKSGGTTRVTYHKTKLEAADAAARYRLEMHTHNDLDRTA